ncbi:MAG TPA: hypothetical protein DEG17_03755 [Cyanobacteria bacterium UBA11149]|nr:hypothetical protein [Cyanobacteria bacterium UBA11367]HBE58242.1 hypothetical protein [Cyanobacteria bacterium UBA11366]HBK66961.1 hypothetical protein [Cyanobacteria bacterium UBA11166]HBR75029.1 hypothetical protein [Cyanobacteria bacterium UBA11159]HBS70768.1 hypothetical protein [Cyanobacteria bacterium UBA11153]HBW88019.1 hypothetical protein [Cyanobacteria bacterium UBA11149]HCA98077.1 hypothetical protein [Cyanobacteria bacterium UBA9226]
MISWDYRVFQEKDGDYAIREVIYGDDGEIIGCTENPVEPFGRTLEELAQSIDDFQAALKLPVLTLEDIPKLPKSPKKRSQTISSAQLRVQLGLSNPTNSQLA